MVTSVVTIWKPSAGGVIEPSGVPPPPPPSGVPPPPPPPSSPPQAAATKMVIASEVRLIVRMDIPSLLAGYRRRPPPQSASCG
jgi:hypothetical protein